MRPLHMALLVLFATITFGGAFTGILGAIFYRNDSQQAASYTTSTCTVLSHTIRDNACFSSPRSATCYQPYWEVAVDGLEGPQWATTTELASYDRQDADKYLTQYTVGGNYTCFYSLTLGGGELADVVWSLPSMVRGYASMGVGFPSCAIGVTGSLVILLYVRKRAYEVYF